MSRRVTAIPWLENCECGNRRVPIDMHIEDYGRGVLPEKYERTLEKFFDTTDKKQMLNRCFKDQTIPILCPGNVVEIVDKDSGDRVRRVAGGRMKRKLVYGNNIPEGKKFGASDGIVNVCLNGRFVKIAKNVFLSERVAQQVVQDMKKDA